MQRDLITRDVLYILSTINRQASYPFKEEPYRLEWHPMNKSQINLIRGWVTDGRNNTSDLNRIKVALSVMIMYIKNHQNVRENFFNEHASCYR